MIWRHAFVVFVIDFDLWRNQILSCRVSSSYPERHRRLNGINMWNTRCRNMYGCCDTQSILCHMLVGADTFVVGSSFSNGRRKYSGRLE